MNTNPLKRLAFDSTNWLYVLLCFPIIDYVLRNILPIPVVSSFWDEGVLIVLLAFSFLASYKGHRKLPAIKHPLIAFFMLGLGLMFTDMAEFDASVEGFRAIYQYVLAFFIGFFLIESTEQLNKYIKVLAAVGFVVAFIGVMQVVLGVQTSGAWIEEGEATTTRAFSIVTSPNVLGSFMAFMSPIGIGLVLAARTRQQKIIWGIVTLTTLAALVFTGSRGAWFALLFVLIVGASAWNKKIGRYALIAALIGALVVLVVPKETPLLGKVQNRITSLFSEEYFEKSSANGRLARWENSYHNMRYEPLFGAGLGHYGGAVGSRHFGTIYADSYFFKTIAETGLLGVTFLLVLMTMVVRYAYKAVLKWREGPHFFLGLGLFCGLFAVGLHNMVENIFEVPFMSTYFWLIGGMLAALVTVNLRFEDMRRR
ncbi:O-antigen ligase family protein [Brevibacillus dissolubilis]|uniref:O-antigen ligase family protein n=1 Tax=Brevibacillus dissolubilis TaxID=1844116 RepID=UPI0021000447|nr:O-antigen ligase family protein [Brevibacillus dissolubilis]